MSKKMIGKVFESNNWGPATVIEYDRKRVTVQFTNTGNIRSVVRAGLYSGNFIDIDERTRLAEVAKEERAQELIAKRYVPRVYGVGFIGHGEFDSHHPLYDCWRRMFRRSYSPEWHERFPTYIGCSVHPDWHCFQDFMRDVEKIPGYELLASSVKVDLDKDVRVPGNKVYSLDTCSFLLPSENSADGAHRRNVSVS